MLTRPVSRVTQVRKHALGALSQEDLCVSASPRGSANASRPVGPAMSQRSDTREHARELRPLRNNSDVQSQCAHEALIARLVAESRRMGEELRRPLRRCNCVRRAIAPFGCRAEASRVESGHPGAGPMRRVLGGQENGCASRCLCDPLNPKTAGPSAQGAIDFNLEIYRERHAPCRVTRWFFASCWRNTCANYSEQSAPRWCAAGADVRDTSEYATR